MKIHHSKRTIRGLWETTNACGAPWYATVSKDWRKVTCKKCLLLKKRPSDIHREDGGENGKAT